MAETRRNKVTAIVQPELDAGEQIVATVGQAQTGPTPWLFLVTYFFIIYWALVLTDRRVIFLKFRSRTMWSKLTLQAGPETLKLNVPRICRDDATAFVQALGAAVSAA